MADQRSNIRRDIWNVPNVLTMGRIALIPIICWFAWLGTPASGAAAATLFGLASFTDWLDGYIARKRNLVSLTGKFLDPLADKLLVMAVFCTLLPADRLPIWFVVVALAREISITALRALAAGEGIIIAAEWGGKWKTALQLVGLSAVLIQHRYTVDYFLFTLDIRFDRIGFAVLLGSLAFSLSSAWTYFSGFLQSIGDRTPSSAASID